MAIFDQKFSLWTFTFGFVYFSAKMCKTISSIRFSGYYNFWPKNNLLGKKDPNICQLLNWNNFHCPKKIKTTYMRSTVIYIIYVSISYFKEKYLIWKKNIISKCHTERKYYTVKIFKERRVIEKTKYLLKSPQKGRMKKNLYFMNVNV